MLPKAKPEPWKGWEDVRSSREVIGQGCFFLFRSSYAFKHKDKYIFKNRHLLNRCILKAKYWWIVIHVTTELSRCCLDAAHLIYSWDLQAEEGVEAWAVSLARTQGSLGVGLAGEVLAPRAVTWEQPAQLHPRRGTDTGLGARSPWAALSSASSSSHSPSLSLFPLVWMSRLG